MTIVAELKHKRGNPRNSEGAFLTLKDGRIMFAYSRYYGNDWSDIATATISAIYSSDGGLTWSKRCRLLIPNEGGCNVMSPSLLRMQNGDLGLFYIRTNGFHDCRLYLRTSPDEGKHWSNPTLCIPAPGYFVVNNDRVVRLSTGRIIFPAAYHRPKAEGSPTDWATWDFRAVTVFYYSDDDGKTWHESADWWGLPVPSRSGMQEPGLIELNDGRLYAWARTDTGRQWQMFSSDQGKHWSAPTPSPFRSPNSSLSMKRCPISGNLIAIWNDYSRRWRLGKPAPNSWGRTPLALATSRNEGKTWGHYTLIEDDPRRGYCYVAVHFIGDALLLAYCYGGFGDGVLQNTRVRYLPR